MEEQTIEKDERLNTLVSILIAIVVVVGAVVAWRASLVDDAAGDADYAGLRAVVNAEETSAINYVNAYQSYGSYVSYWRNSRLAELISSDLESAPEEQVIALVEQAKSANDLADANRTMFETRYLNRDGSYSVQRQMGEMWADALKEKEMDYESQFKEADQLRQKTHNFLIAFMILTVAPVFYSLVESFAGRARYVMVVIGSLFALAGTIMAILIELGKF